jgi:hypothetical protein
MLTFQHIQWIPENGAGGMLKLLIEFIDSKSSTPKQLDPYPVRLISTPGSNYDITADPNNTRALQIKDNIRLNEVYQNREMIKIRISWDQSQLGTGSPGEPMQVKMVLMGYTVLNKYLQMWSENKDE